MKVQKRRRRKHKTDYLKRLKLLKSGKPRIVFRKTNRYIIVQYVKSEEARDKVVMGLDSRELLKYGWDEKAKSGLKNLTASYLLGYLFGKKVIGKKLENPVLDTGMNQALHKNKVYAFIKGLIDAELKIQCKKEVFPEESRIKGEHLKNKVNFDEIKSKIENGK